MSHLSISPHLPGALGALQFHGTPVVAIALQAPRRCGGTGVLKTDLIDRTGRLLINQTNLIWMEEPFSIFLICLHGVFYGLLGSIHQES